MEKYVSRNPKHKHDARPNVMGQGSPSLCRGHGSWRRAAPLRDFFADLAHPNEQLRTVAAPRPYSMGSLGLEAQCQGLTSGSG